MVADAMMSKLISDSTVTQRPDVEQRVRQQIAGCPPATIAWIQRAMAQRPDSFDVLDAFDGPVLVIVGSGRVVAASGCGGDGRSLTAGHADRDPGCRALDATGKSGRCDGGDQRMAGR